jgi:hypothetical protein
MRLSWRRVSIFLDAQFQFWMSEAIVRFSFSALNSLVVIPSPRPLPSLAFPSWTPHQRGLLVYKSRTCGGGCLSVEDLKYGRSLLMRR